MRPTITLRFEFKFQIIAQLFDLIRFEMKKNTIRTALVNKRLTTKSIYNAVTYIPKLQIDLIALTHDRPLPEEFCETVSRLATDEQPYDFSIYLYCLNCLLL